FRSESLFAPVTVQVRIDYELYMTPLRWEPNAPELAAKDRNFTLRDEYALQRWYRCDAQGRPVGELSAFLPRPKPSNLRLFEFEPGSGLLNPFPPGAATRTYPQREIRTMD